MSCPFWRVLANLERLLQAKMRCHSVRVSYSPLSFFQLSWVAMLRTTYSLLFWVVLASAFCPRRPMRMTLLNMVFGSVSFGLSAGCGTCLPNGCAVAIHSLGEWTESAEGDHSLPGVRSPHLAEARSGFWERERASEGRGCFERGTLNADRKANLKGAALFNGFPSWCEQQKPVQKLR